MLHIFPLAARSDNYIWIIRHNEQVAIVDPTDSAPVLTMLAQTKWQPTTILLTHNHADHTDGVAEIRAHYPDLTIYGSNELNAFTTIEVEHNDCFELFGKTVQVIDSAGHTVNHISYLLGNEHLFCGDALFYGGCGRVFTGDYQAQFNTLQRFKALPDWVKVYCGHEYTLSNLQFAEKVSEPSCMLAEHLELAAMHRAQNRPTLPSSIGVEKQINPFLRAKTLEEFTALRKQKDNS